jgi:methylase of polypeptide subunit release factors
VTGWISEWHEPAPGQVSPVDDRSSAKDVLFRLEAGEVLRWAGDFHNGRQFLGAVKKRLARRRRNLPSGLGERWRAHRDARSEQATIIGRLVIRLEADGSIQLRRAPDTRRAIELAWGTSQVQRLVGFSTLLGAISAASWTERRLDVPGLNGRLTPHYGVFSPTRHVYVQMLQDLPDVRGKSVLDVGCGTGVLAFVLLQRGAVEAVGTDIDERSVRCAAFNAEALGLPFRAVLADLWSDDLVADLVVFNAPWMPEAPRTRLDRAVYDDNGDTLARWLRELPRHLTADGRGVLLVSDLPELLGLRETGELEREIEAAGLRIVNVYRRPAVHRKTKESDDPLHAARAAEQVCMWVLGF